MNKRRNPVRILPLLAFAAFAYSYSYGTPDAKTRQTHLSSPDENGRMDVGYTPALEMSSAYTPPNIDTTIKEPETGLPSSLIVVQDHTVVRLAPRRKARRRGVVMKDARLKPSNAVNGPGCRTPWYKVHTDGWICGDLVRVSDLPSWGQRYPVVPQGELTPWPYGFVREPTIEYRLRRGNLEEIREVLKGFGFGVQGYSRIDGEKFFRTAEGTFIPRKAAGVAGRISKFSGVRIKDGAPRPLGFVNAKKAWAYNSPSRSKHFRIGRVDRYTPFEVLGFSGKGRKLFYRFDEGAWLYAGDVRVTTTAPAPKGLEPGERWIDVDVKQQIVTAYEGDKPVYVTLVSTGRVGASRTVKGEYRVWAKVSAIAMDNTDEELEETAEDEVVEPDAGTLEERKLYSLHDVPWAQFFFESYALHGVYWHDRFGNRRSHGCVNLAPADARWFFDWTAPHLPDGWWAMHTSPNDRGTLVRVR